MRGLEGLDPEALVTLELVIAERDKLREHAERLVYELGLIASQRTSDEVLEEEGTDEYADYQGGYDTIVERARESVTAYHKDYPKENNDDRC